jgi:NADH-quinone oxidoreductase subunit N
MFVFLLSLGGIPPTAGFIGKYFLFYAVMQAGFGWLAIIAVLMSAVSMFYYLRFVVAMYLRDGKEADVTAPGSLRLVAAVCLVVTIFFGILPNDLVDTVSSSARWVHSHGAVTRNAVR